MKSTFWMRAAETERELKSREINFEGTTWVAPGEGATIRELSVAAFYPTGRQVKMLAKLLLFEKETTRTNLALTGYKLREYDYQRLENVSIAGPDEDRK